MSSTSGSKKMTSREKHVANFTFFRFPVLLFALCAGIYFALIPTGSWILFSNHPFFMTLGAVGLPINAALVKKIGKASMHVAASISLSKSRYFY